MARNWAILLRVLSSTRTFFEDFREVLGRDHVIQKFDKLDFSEIREHLALQRNLKKIATDEEKLLRKEEKEAAVLKYGYALIDGRLEKVRKEDIKKFCDIYVFCSYLLECW